MRTLYSALFNLLLPVLALRMFWRARGDPGHKDNWRQRFAEDLPRISDARPIWIHAVSVGETIAAIPVVQAIHEEYPDIPILLTSTTPTGAATVKARLGNSVEHAYFPYDTPRIVRKYLAHFEPRLLILMETELWPNLLFACYRRDIPVLIANARMSARSMKRYQLVRDFVAEMLRAVHCFAVQSEQDAQRFINLGANKDNIVTAGSLKFDLELAPSVLESGQAMRRFLGVNRTVIMGGSTREGEETLLLDSYATLKVENSNLLMLLAPRHPNRFATVSQLCIDRGLQVAKYSEGDRVSSATDIFLIDSMGELPVFYAASDVAFVGGSLVPKGGHNVLEPAAVGTPVVVGVHTYNFSEIVPMLFNVGALTICDDDSRLAESFLHWLNDSEARDRAGRAGKALVAENRGTKARIMSVVRPHCRDNQFLSE